MGEATKNGLECTSLRIGQVCGSKSTGAWGTTEWVPILVKSSTALGMLPNLDGVSVICSRGLFFLVMTYLTIFRVYLGSLRMLWRSP